MTTTSDRLAQWGQPARQIPGGNATASGVMGGRLVPDVQIHDWAARRSQSIALDRYARKDFSGVRDRAREVFGVDTSSEMIDMPLPVVHRMAVEHADAYSLPPVRQVEGLDPAWYERLGLDAKFRDMNELLISQQTGFLLAMPSSDGRQIATRTLRPWEVEVIPDPRQPDSLSRAKEVRCRVPVSTDAESTGYGVLVMNARGIYTETGAGRVPTWTPDGSNPFDGRLPITYVRNGFPEDGMMFAPLPTELLAAQEALILAWMDIALGAQFQTFGQRWTNGKLAAQMKMGHGVWQLDKDQRLEIAQAQPTLQQYIDVVEHYLRLIAQLGGLSYDGLAKGYQSALARQMGLADRWMYRVRHRTYLRDMEARAVKMLGMVLAYMKLAPASAQDAKVAVTYQDMPFPADPLAEAQADQINVELGLDSPVDIIARRRRVSRDEAEQIHAQNLADRDAAKRAEVAA